jgi:hypothetical protein
VTVPQTGGWQSWTTVTVPVSLPAGHQVLTLAEDTGGWNIDALALASAGGTPNPDPALDKPASAGGSAQSYAPGNAVDGNASSYWESTNNAFPQWFQVDLARRRTSPGSC